jgi:FAD-dependent urate hydroxylase
VPQAGRRVRRDPGFVQRRYLCGNGGAYIPPVLTEGLPADLCAHTADSIDFAALRGKEVAVVGAAASALDAAAVALEAGAASVHLFARRPVIA